MNLNLHIEIIRPGNAHETTANPDRIADFLFKNLEQYRDSRNHIFQCLNYALGRLPGRSGFICLARDQAENSDSTMGVAVVLETGMSGYVPENLLVYLAVKAGERGRGVGKKMLEVVLQTVKGDIALHVEPDNPALQLYKRAGFKQKYLEMRFQQPAEPDE